MRTRKFAVIINTIDHTIVIDDRKTKTEYVFEEGRNFYEENAHLCWNEYNFGDCVPIEEMENPEWHTDKDGRICFETDIDPIGTKFPIKYDIKDFDSFYKAMETFYAG